jgi:hypothetical protein
LRISLAFIRKISLRCDLSALFSLSLRERAGVRDDQKVSLLGSPLTLSLGERELSCVQRVALKGRNKGEVK